MGEGLKRAAAAARRPAGKKKEPELRQWPADAVERRPTAEIKPYPRNARLHDDEQVRQIALSMLRFGVTVPVLVDEDGVLIYGHGRLMAAQALAKGGMKLADGAESPPRPEFAQLPVVVARGWSENEKNAYRLADNQIALNSSWDLPVLKAELAQLSKAGFDGIGLIGFPDAKLVQFTATPKPPGDFQSFGEDIRTEHECPQCGYRWSGSSKPREGGDENEGDGEGAA